MCKWLRPLSDFNFHVKGGRSEWIEIAFRESRQARVALDAAYSVKSETELADASQDVLVAGVFDHVFQTFVRSLESVIYRLIACDKGLYSGAAPNFSLKNIEQIGKVAPEHEKRKLSRRRSRGMSASSRFSSTAYRWTSTRGRRSATAGGTGSPSSATPGFTLCTRKTCITRTSAQA